MLTKKNNIIVLFVLSITLTLLTFVIGCSNENDNYRNDRDPKLKSLITSAEYKNLNKNLINFGKELKSNYSKLSKTDKEKVIDILNTINEQANSQEELKKLFEEFTSITKIDFEANINEINQNVVELNLYRKANNVSNKELSLAVNKYPNGNIPRVKTTREVDGDITNCMNACAGLFAICAAICMGPQALVGCHAGCLAVYAACALSC